MILKFKRRCHGDNTMLLLCIFTLLLIAAVHASSPYSETLHAYLKRYNHKIEIGPSNRLLISTTRGTLGLGNRMLAHASALAYAILTNRTLLIHSPDVDLSEVFSFPSDKMIISQPSYNKLFKSNRFAGSVVKVDVSHDAKDGDWRELVCGDMNDKADAIVLSGGQYFLPLLLSKHELWFRTIFPDFTTAYHQLARSLFHPAKAVQDLIESNRFNGYDVGIQLRSFKLRYDKQQDVSAKECIDRHHLHFKHIFVASLYKQHRQFFLKHYGHADTLSSFELQSNQLEQYQYALAEMYTLARSKVLLVSPYSTFGYSAMALRSDEEFQNVFMLDQRVSCRQVKVEDREPCFHKAPRATGYCMDGSPVWPNRNRLVKACPDYHKRGVKLA